MSIPLTQAAPKFTHQLSKLKTLYLTAQLQSGLCPETLLRIRLEDELLPSQSSTVGPLPIHPSTDRHSRWNPSPPNFLTFFTVLPVSITYNQSQAQNKRLVGRPILKELSSSPCRNQSVLYLSSFSWSIAKGNICGNGQLLSLWFFKDHPHGQS